LAKKEMKKIISISMIGLSLLILVNCSPKTTKTTITSSNDKKERTTDRNNTSSTGSSSTTFNSSSSSSTSASSSNVNTINSLLTLAPDRVSKGRIVYEASCKKCHDLYSPGSRMAESWVSIMREMGPKANLSPDHYTMVSAYLVQNARK
jgi:hypothetical protein